MARLRHSLSGATTLPVVGVWEEGTMTRKRKTSPPTMTVEEFHRECVRVAAKLKAAGDSSRMLFFSPGETDAA